MLQTIKRALLNRVAAQQVGAVCDILNGETLTLVDVGAAGGIEPRWKPYAPLLDYIAFEPDAGAYERISNPVFHSHEIIPKALWSTEGPLTIHISREEGKSSHYPPNMDLMRRYPRPERIETVKTVTVPAVRMDDVLRDHRCDFIKIDTQGAELEILKGATGILPRCIGLELEVEFLPIYQEQPLFGDLCVYLAERGFEFVDFLHLARWERDGFTDVGQCMFGDALFLRTGQVDTPQYRAVLTIYERLDLLHRVDPAVGTRRRKAAAKRRITRFVRNVLEVL